MTVEIQFLPMTFLLLGLFFLIFMSIKAIIEDADRYALAFMVIGGLLMLIGIIIALSLRLGGLT